MYCTVATIRTEVVSKGDFILCFFFWLPPPWRHIGPNVCARNAELSTFSNSATMGVASWREIIVRGIGSKIQAPIAASSYFTWC